MPPSVLTSSPEIVTLADLLDRLGRIPAERVRYYPLPGTATEDDLIELSAREDRLFELVDGTIVEKPVGLEESLLAGWIIQLLLNYVDRNNAGWVAAPDAMLRIVPGQVRLPDVCFIARALVPDGKRPRGPIGDLSPHLAIEILSRSNTKAEMARKRREYFAGGTRLVWEFDHKTRTVAIYTSPETPDATLGETDILRAESLLPGFELQLSKLFARLDD